MPERTAPMISLQFYLKGKLFAARRWHATPRVGDEIMFGPGKPKKPYRVKRVCWGVEGPEEEMLQLTAVNVEIVAVRHRNG